MITQDDCVRDGLKFAMKKAHKVFIGYLLLSVCSALGSRWALSLGNPLALNIGVRLLPMFFFGLPLVYMTLNAVDGRSTTLADLLSPFSMKNIRFFFYQILALIIVGLGMVLFVVPGVYAACSFAFAPYILAAENTGIVEALKMSAARTRGLRFRIFSLIILSLVFLFTVVMLSAALMYWLMPAQQEVASTNWQYMDYAFVVAYGVFMSWLVSVLCLSLAWMYRHVPKF